MQGDSVGEEALDPSRSSRSRADGQAANEDENARVDRHALLPGHSHANPGASAARRMGPAAPASGGDEGENWQSNSFEARRGLEDGRNYGIRSTTRELLGEDWSQQGEHVRDQKVSFQYCGRATRQGEAAERKRENVYFQPSSANNLIAPAPFVLSSAPLLVPYSGGDGWRRGIGEWPRLSGPGGANDFQFQFVACVEGS